MTADDANPPRRPRRLRRPERGAAVIEYALVVAVVVIGAVAGIEAMEGEAEEYYEETSTEIGDLPHENKASTTTWGGATTTASTTTTTPPPPTTTTTTAPPTTTTPPPPTTTTTEPPSTTSEPPTTTTVPTTTTTTVLGPSNVDVSAHAQGFWAWWRSILTVTVTDGDTGEAVSGAAASVTLYVPGGSFATGCTTGAGGTCTITTGWVSWSSYPWMNWVLGALSADPAWDGQGASAFVSAP